MKNDDVTVTAIAQIPTPFDRDGDDSSYKWSEIRERLELSSNVANARWMPEKIMPLFSKLETPKLLTEQGRPTKFCAQWLSRYKTFCCDGGNDYSKFVTEIKTIFRSDEPKAVPVEVLSDDSEGYKVSSPDVMQRMEEQVEEQEDTLQGKLMLAVQTARDANKAIARYTSLESKSWEQQVIEDEIAKFQEEQERKKQEAELRAKVREMLQKQAQQAEQ